MSAKTAKTPSFEEAIEELEEITRKLEDGKESLERSMELYERGVLLKEICEKKLKEAEGKWAVLKKGTNGKIEKDTIDKEEILNPEARADNRGQQESMF